jgi:hypothetical protein
MRLVAYREDVKNRQPVPRPVKTGVLSKLNGSVPIPKLLIDKGNIVRFMNDVKYPYLRKVIEVPFQGGIN